MRLLVRGLYEFGSAVVGWDTQVDRVAGVGMERAPEAKGQMGARTATTATSSFARVVGIQNVNDNVAECIPS